MKKKFSNSLIIGTIILILFSNNNLFSQVHSATSAHTSFTGLSMTGYQGWFGTTEDGVTNGWRHYGGNGSFRPGYASIEYWPDMREADEDEKYITPFVFDDGSPAYVFSSVHPKTVSRHFQWMKEYGIDGALMQRFSSDVSNRPYTMDVILKNGLDAAKEHGRAIGLMYDVSGNVHINGVPNDAKRTEEVNKLFNDWKKAVDNLGLTTGGDDQPYLYHNGKPLIVLWGVGFSHRHHSTGLDMEYWVELFDSLKNSPTHGGCSIMVGVPREWRTGSGMSEHAKFLEVMKTIDIVEPWHTSRYSRAEMGSSFKNIVIEDIAWCDTYGIQYVPTVSPGIREKILHGNGYEKPREGGYYFWDMAKAALEAGSKMLYLGMFDEIDEGTQYHKINNNPPFFSNDIPFADYGSNPEDHYLWLAGEATRALKGEFTMGATFRERADYSDFISKIIFNDNGTTYDMELGSSPSDRKVYYADPYKVPDGAPTVGTVRDNNLFGTELTSESVTFSEAQRWQYIRLVEVNGADEILGYKAIVATHRYSSILYSTSFEEGDINPEFWTTNLENSSGRIEVTNEFSPKSGNYHLILDANQSGIYSVNSADLHLKLESSLKDIILKFSLKTFGDEVHPEDGIYFSDDAGENFSKVYDIKSTSDYSDIKLNLSVLADSVGLRMSKEFIIRFQNKSNSPSNQDGIALDEISIDYSNETSGAAKFIEIDTNTQGAWMWHYGIDGYYIVGKDSKLPEDAEISWDENSKTVIWEDNSTDVRGLQFDENLTIKSARYADAENDPWSFTLDVGEKEKSVSLYFLDGGNHNRRIVIDVLDKATGDLYDAQTIQSFGNGRWYTWKIKGEVRFVLDLLQGPNAVISGIFINPSAPTEINVGNFLTFDGADDFVDCGNDESLQITGTEITLEAWFKIHGSKSALHKSTIIGMDHSESNNDLGYFVRANGNGELGWGFGDGNWNQISSDIGDTLFETNMWNHIAGVYDGTYQKLYLNGNLIAISDSFKTSLVAAPTENLYIGSTPSFTDRVVDASLAEVRIWNIARTSSEIKEYFSQRLVGSETGLAAYWPIDEGEGQTILDLSSNSNDGILGGIAEETSADPIWTKATTLSIPIVDGLDDAEEVKSNFSGHIVGSINNGSDDLELIFDREPLYVGLLFRDVQLEPNATINNAYIQFTVDAVVERTTDADIDIEIYGAKEPTVDAITKDLFSISGHPKTSAIVEWNPLPSVAVGDAGLAEQTSDLSEIISEIVSQDGWVAGNNILLVCTGDAGLTTDINREFESFNGSPDGAPVLKITYAQSGVTSVEESGLNIPSEYSLKQNYPNPFNPSTTIEYSLPEISKVELSVYNILGQKVAELVNKEMSAGTYNVRWDAANLSSGIYFVALRANSMHLTKKMILLK